MGARPRPMDWPSPNSKLLHGCRPIVRAVMGGRRRANCGWAVEEKWEELDLIGFGAWIAQIVEIIHASH